MNIRFAFAMCATASLAACSALAPKYHYTEKPATLKLTLLPTSAIAPGKSSQVEAKLTSRKTLSLVHDADLELVHGHKIHLLVIDPSLTEYQHIHPAKTDTDGVYSFGFTPQHGSYYRVFADVTPTATHAQEFTFADLGQRRAATINRSESHDATAGNYHFTLSFDKPAVEGAELEGTLHVTDGKGNAALQPLMGAYAHIVGFYDDFRTVAHTHPLDTPNNASAHTSSDIHFHFEPVKPGFVKLFAQVKIGGHEVIVPFGVNVASRDGKK